MGEVRCFPAKTRRREDSGMPGVRRARRERRVPTEVEAGRVRGKVSPATFLTKICMVDSGSADDAREEEMEEMLLERMLMAVVCVMVVVVV